jgi:hypothetical protein
MDTIAGLALVGGSVIGREHRRAGRGGQDGFGWVRGERAVVAVVADGCGSGAHSEVGAKLGVALWAQAMVARLDGGAAVGDPALWRAVRADVVDRLGALAAAMAGESALRDVVADYFLFTLVGAAITAESTALFAIGDGTVVRDGAVTAIGPFADNQPPYLGYELLGMPSVPVGAELLEVVPTAEVGSILLATDGASEIADDELRALAADEALVRNPDAVRRRLALLGREQVEVDWTAGRLRRSSGRLGDDTTIVIVRRSGG